MRVPQWGKFASAAHQPCLTKIIQKLGMWRSRERNQWTATSENAASSLGANVRPTLVGTRLENDSASLFKIEFIHDIMQNVMQCGLTITLD